MSCPQCSKQLKLDSDGGWCEQCQKYWTFDALNILDEFLEWEENE